ncbi:uncharacterized protein LOC107042425 [Diachasma alloeum]|uniref:uncharacterized protein LOC107042425 n=1 Tax=Diachasma alloeum TaxID=454923 RepID=UPI0007384845|nr:uncharacterized protein LOC107042425 [Diachasma alloeum]
MKMMSDDKIESSQAGSPTVEPIIITVNKGGLLASDATRGVGSQTQQSSEWLKAFQRLEELASGLEEFVQPRSNVHKEIKSKVTSLCSVVRRLKVLERQSVSIQIQPSEKSPRMRLDSETTTKDSEIEDSDVGRGDRDIRKALRRKRSKDSPGMTEQTLKKHKKQSPPKQDDRSAKEPIKQDWTRVEHKKGRKKEEKIEKKKSDLPKKPPHRKRKKKK